MNVREFYQAIAYIRHIIVLQIYHSFRRPLKSLICSLTLISTLVAAFPVISEEIINNDIEEIIVVGARLPRPVDNVAAKVDVITHGSLVNEMANSMGDVTRYVPGINVVTADTRFGETEITIRGLSGNRVTSLIDGVPLPDQFDIGAFANAGHDFLIPDAVSRVEILRGPASTLFGSDALGGVVATITREPEEFLQNRDRHTGINTKYSGRDDSTTVNGSFALAADRISGVIHASYFTGHEIDRSAVDIPDMQDRDRLSLLSRFNYKLDNGNKLRFDLSLFDENVQSDVVSVLGYGRQFANTTSLLGDDRRQRIATTLGYDFSMTDWIDNGRVNLYWQQAEVDQNTSELRAPINRRIERNFEYDTNTFGLTLDLETAFTTGELDHRLGWGLALEHSYVSELRDGRSRDLVAGTSTNILLGEEFPVRDFPESEMNELAFYLHDEIKLADFSLIPALRYQFNSMDARADPLFLEDNPGTTIHDKSESSLSPKLGVLWDLTSDTQLYLQYAYGFRAPPFEDVNIGLYNPLFNYRAVPNPDLKPEKSNGLELGTRYRTDRYRINLTLFGVEYDDLIETKVNLGPDPVTGTLIFQSRNIDEAYVYGFEISFHSDLNHWLQGLTFDAAANITRGKNRTTGRPLNTVDPAELVLALAWNPDDRSRLSLITTVVDDKDRVDRSQSDITTTDGYISVDLTGSYQVTENIRLDAGIFNALDKTYWRWSSVRNRTFTDPMIDYLSGPGRYAVLSVRVNL